MYRLGTLAITATVACSLILGCSPGDDDATDIDAIQSEDSSTEADATSADDTTEPSDDTTDPEPSDDTTEPAAEDAEPFSLSAGVNEITWEQELAAGPVTRHLVIHTPPSYPNHGPIPTMFGFHGNSSDAPEGAEPEKLWLGKLGPMVDQEKFIGVYLRGISGSWQLGPEPGEATTEEVIEAIEYLKARLAVTPGVNDEVTYCFGTSNGAALCQYSAANIGLFSGIGAEVSTLDEGDFPEADVPKIPVVQMMNFKDSLIPYEGGSSNVGHTFMPAEDGAAAWAAHNGCDLTPAEAEVTDPYKKTLTYSGCDADTFVVHVGVMPIPWDDACEDPSQGPPDPELCGGTHTVADEHFALPGGPWRYAFDLLSGAP